MAHVNSIIKSRIPLEAKRISQCLICKRSFSHKTILDHQNSGKQALTDQQADPATIQRTRKLRSIISLYHTAEHFAPLSDNERLVQFIDDSLLFKKPPTQYAAPNSSNVLASTIKTLPFNRPILRSGESEHDLNPVMSGQRIRVGKERWKALQDALCGTSSDQSQDEPSRTPGSFRFGSNYGAVDTLSGSLKTESSGGKAGLEIVKDNWEQIKRFQQID
ncbi:hypothetical protein O181_118465 [Austropuccinia psidii MF-1]|uniref:Uncharacterized protein n=1 Tax=Austropuccinia psidii MF-1 TaxID=1389203 RepID=A0A9Q3PZE8_9BASI|nr:hypothetical protein [Austropuccinia psidii MF-1]